MIDPFFRFWSNSAIDPERIVEIDYMEGVLHVFLDTGTTYEEEATVRRFNSAVKEWDRALTAKRRLR